MVKKMNTEERIYNVLMGIAYGDALGMPTENYTKEGIKKTFGYVDHFIEAPSDGPINRTLKAGQITDDTANSIFICDMLLKTHGKIDSDNFVESLINWLDNDPDAASVTGPSTFAAVTAIKKGTPLSEAGKNGTTNGAAMKMGPLGLILDYRDVSNLVANVNAICIPTHNTQIAIQGASIITAAVSYFFNNQTINWNEFYEVLYATAYEAAKYGNRLPTPDIVARIKYGRKLADSLSEADFQDQLYSFLGTGLPTIETVPAVISILYRYKGDLKKSVLTSVNIGGDTDTIAALCGAICGSYHFNINSQDINQLEEINHLGFHKIAEQLTNLIEER